MSSKWEIVALDQKSMNRIVIAHISDLHLESDSDLNGPPWTTLRQSLHENRDRIDLVVVTGDLVELPGLTSAGSLLNWRWGGRRNNDPEPVFRKVREYLIDLCLACKVDPAQGLLIVPGNHDVRRGRGTVSFDAHALRTFRNVFAAEMPSSRFYPGLGLAFFLFDSNPRVPNRDRNFPDFAGGYVQPRELESFRTLIREGPGDEQEAYNTAFKIALIHHHPLPIGPTQRAEQKVLGAEAVMLLKNAGVFLDETLRGGVDLVLHGHRHYPAVSQATSLVPDPTVSNRQHVRSLSVVAAGSVGQDGDHPLSYNYLAIEVSGEVLLDRLWVRNATYEQELVDQPVIAYHRARRRVLRQRLELLNPLLQMKAFRSHWRIAPGSGDTAMWWEVESVTTRGRDPVAFLHRKFTSHTAYYGKPKYREISPRTQSVKFDWVDPDHDRGQGMVRFNPPIHRKDPISFTASNTIYNAFHFNRQDRRDATDSEIDYEEAAVRTQVTVQSLVMSVVFPTEAYPKSFWVRAERLERLDAERGELDLRESRFAECRLAELPLGRAVSLHLEDPLPGYRYSICWDLPESEQQEMSASKSVWLFVKEVRQRLLQAGRRSAIESCLEALGGEEPLSSESDSQGGQVDIALFVYHEEQRGLVSCAASGSTEFREGLERKIVRVGRTLVGQAYRRREIVVAVTMPGEARAEFYCDASDPPVLHENRTVGIATPLFCPMPKRTDPDLRLAVLWVGTTSLLSSLTKVQEDKKRREKLIERLTVDFRDRLLVSIGLRPDAVSPSTTVEGM